MIHKHFLSGFWNIWPSTEQRVSDEELRERGLCEYLRQYSPDVYTKDDAGPGRCLPFESVWWNSEGLQDKWSRLSGGRNKWSSMSGGRMSGRGYEMDIWWVVKNIRIADDCHRIKGAEL